MKTIKNYIKGGLIIIPINPGGGNETSENRNAGDSFLYPIIHAFKEQKEDPINFIGMNLFQTLKKQK